MRSILLSDPKPENGDEISAGEPEDLLAESSFDFTLDDELGFRRFTRDCVHEHDVQQAFVYNSVLYTNFFEKSRARGKTLYDTFNKGTVRFLNELRVLVTIFGNCADLRSF